MLENISIVSHIQGQEEQQINSNLEKRIRGGSNEDFMTIEHSEWTLDIGSDLGSDSLIFHVVVQPNRWLAIGLSNDLLETKIIQWVSPAKSIGSEEPQEEIGGSTYEAFLTQGVMHDHHKAKLVSAYETLGAEQGKSQFTTWLPLSDAKSFLQPNETSVRISIRSGPASHFADWNESFDHGQIDYILNSSAALGEESKPSFKDARIKAYEIHGWICLVAWFPLGYALIATKRYFKTHWYAMHHSHNVLGLLVTGLTVGTCIQVYAYADWKQ